MVGSLNIFGLSNVNSNSAVRSKRLTNFLLYCSFILKTAGGFVALGPVLVWAAAMLFVMTSGVDREGAGVLIGVVGGLMYIVSPIGILVWLFGLLLGWATK